MGNQGTKSAENAPPIRGASAYAFAIALLLLSILQGIVVWLTNDVVAIQWITTGFAVILFLMSISAFVLVKNYGMTTTSIAGG